MRRKGLGQSDLVKQCGAPKNLVSDWVRGKRAVSATYLPRVSRALEIPIFQIAPRKLRPLLAAHEADVLRRAAA
jgi:transcriptional regulator with XRE-family HTH domain